MVEQNGMLCEITSQLCHDGNNERMLVSLWCYQHVLHANALHHKSGKARPFDQTANVEQNPKSGLWTLESQMELDRTQSCGQTEVTVCAAANELDWEGQTNEEVAHGPVLLQAHIGQLRGFIEYTTQ